jgi:hypothetical protein
VLGLSVLGVTSTLPACNGPPDKTCYADHVNALHVEGDAGPEHDCVTCLQTKGAPHACCDAVGACDEDPKKECVPSIKATQECVMDGGASEEERCKDLLTNDRSKTLYQCMRDTCGAECHVPHCNLEQSVILFANPTCDRCVSGSCCDPINKCYGNRRCKLAVECIATHCTATVGPSMSEVGALPPEQRAAQRNAICNGADAVGVSGDRCLQECLDEFAPLAGGTKSDREARCEAFDVYACAAEANCGPKCDQPDSGPYAPGGTWPDQ